MANYLRNTNSQDRNQIQVKNFKGLRSAPPDTITPDALYIGKNFVFKQEGILSTRNGINLLYSDNVPENVTDAVEFTLASGNNTYLGYARALAVHIWDGSTLSRLIYETEVNFLNPTTTERSLVAAFNCLYIVDGSPHIWKYDGSSVTQINIPESNTYGNIVDLEFHFNRLFLLTEKGYLRISEPGSDNVYEERILLPGTVSTSASTVTGTGTIFQDAQIERGTRLFITDGTLSEYAYVANVTNNTSLTLSQNLVNTFSAGSLVYIVGSDYIEQLDPTDGLEAKKIQRFSNFIAVSKASKSNTSTDSKLYILSFFAQDDTSALLVRPQLVSGTYALHPFSLAEYEDSLLYLTDRGLYTIGTSSQDSTSLKPIYLSPGKLDNYMKNLNKTLRHVSRIRSITNNGVDIILIGFAIKENSSYCDTLIAAFNTRPDPTSIRVDPFIFEFTEIVFYTEGTGLFDNLLQKYNVFLNYAGDVYLIGNPGVYKILIEGETYDELQSSYTSLFCDSTTVFCDNTDILCNLNTAYVTKINKPIERKLQFGAMSNELFNNLTISKMYLSASEARASSAFSSDYYNIQQILDNQFPGFTVARVYDFGNISGTSITFDSNSITFSFDKTTWTFDNGTTPERYKEAIEYFCNTRRFKTISLLLEDNFSDGTLSLWSYGFIIKPTRFN